MMLQQQIVDTGESSGRVFTGERLPDTVRDVSQGVGVAKALGEAEVDAVAQLRGVGAHHEVGWLDVAVNQVPRVDLIYGGEGARA